MILRSKPDDVRYQARTIRTAAGLDDQRHNALLLAPPYQRQYPEFAAALERVWQQGGWTTYVDELFYADKLGLRHHVERLLTQGRSKGISLMVGMQRPVAVTRFALSEARHVLTFRLEGRDAKEIGDATTKAFGALCTSLPSHHFAWYERPQPTAWVGKLDLKAGRLVGQDVKLAGA